MQYHRGAHKPIIDNFKSLVKNTIHKNHISIVAEEWNPEYNKRVNKVTSSTVQEVSIETGTEYFPCEPSQRDRDENRHPSQISPDFQEIFWISCIKEKINQHKKILFICGNRHIYTFKDKLEKDTDCEFLVTTVTRNW